MLTKAVVITCKPSEFPSLLEKEKSIFDKTNQEINNKYLEDYDDEEENLDDEDYCPALIQPCCHKLDYVHNPSWGNREFFTMNHYVTLTAKIK